MLCEHVQSSVTIKIRNDHSARSTVTDLNRRAQFKASSFRIDPSLKQIIRIFYRIKSIQDDNIKMTVELITPIAMEEKLRFAIREGGKTVGAGVVTKILQ